MTNRNETMQPRPDADALRALARTAGIVGIAASLLVAPLAGCGGEEEEAPVVAAPPPPPPPPPPPAPTVTPIAQLMKELGISDKIRLPEEKAPATDPERVAVLKFFDGFAKSQPDGIRAAMAADDAAVLDAMKATGAFASACAPVTRIDLATKVVNGKGAVIAVFRTKGQVEAQLWNFKAEGEGKKVTSQQFTSVYQPVEIMSRLSGNDLVGAWVAVAEAERKVATEPDEVLKPTAKVEEQEKPEASEGGGGGDGPIGAPPMRNKPPPGGIDKPKGPPGGPGSR
ncbi:MAG: hypothetical protein ACKOEL_06170 [Planctomycetota bacterium]|jgi:hypothetical protein